MVAATLGFVFFSIAITEAPETCELAVRVLDAETAEALAGATVIVSSSQPSFESRALITNPDGWARFCWLREASDYTVEARMPGFAAQRLVDVAVRAESTRTLEIRLPAQKERIEERVQVSGAGDVVDLNEVGETVRFSHEFIEALPAPGRFYQDILSLAPGVNDEDRDGNPNIHGSRSRDFRAEVSGVSNVDPLTGHWLGRVNADSIETLEVMPLGAGVEFGRAQGGFARIVQKQGGNEIEGVFSMLYRTSELDEDGAGNVNPTEEPPQFDTYEPAFQLSGPLIRDKLWFRLSHQYVQRQEPTNVLGAIAVSTTTQRLNADQLTWYVTPRHKLAFQYQNDPLVVDGLGIDSHVGLESSRTLERSGPTYSLTWTAPRSARVLFESILAHQDHSVDLVPTAEDPTATAHDCARTPNLPGLGTTRCVNLTNGFHSGPHYETSLDHRRRTTFRFQSTLQQIVLGQSHRFKLGLVVEEEEYARQLVRRPDLAMRVTNLFLLGEPRALVVARVSLPESSEAQASGTSWAAYVEDQWRPTSSFSLTLGLRVDREEITSVGRAPIDAAAEAARFLALAEAAGIDLAVPNQASLVALRDLATAVFTSHEDLDRLRQDLAAALQIPAPRVGLDPILAASESWRGRRIKDIVVENTNFSPRLSAAWDPWDNGKTKLFGSIGRYYDKIFLAVPLVELEPIETTLFLRTLTIPQTLPLVFTTNADRATLSPLTVRFVNRNLRTPYQDEVALGFERELAPETSLRVTWLRRRFRDQFQDVDINNATGDHGSCVSAVDSLGRTIVRLVASPGSGDTRYDAFTQEAYPDTDSGIGDGRLDDCSGRIVLEPVPLDRADGRPDLYLQNPAWREILLLGNANRSEYEAFVLELLRRQQRNWQFEASYTWSQAMGDAEDFDLLLGNEQNLRDDERGFLSFDQRHVVKINAARIAPGGLQLGTTVRWESGLPFSVVGSSLRDFSIPPFYPYTVPDFTPRPSFTYPTGQRNDQRNPSYWTLDVRVAKNFRLAQSVLMELSAEAFNLLNDDTLRLTSREDGVNIGTRRFGRQFQLGLRVTF